MAQNDTPIISGPTPEAEDRTVSISARPDWATSPQPNAIELDDLGLSHLKQFRGTGMLGDLERAIECFSRALTLTHDGHPDISLRYASLGMSYSDRFHRLGELTDLEKAIEYSSLALASTPDGHPHISLRYANLGVFYRDRFQRLGELTDLEKSIEYSSLALASTPDGHPHMSQRYTNLGSSYRDRFRRLGELTDLEKAIECCSLALASTPDGHPGIAAGHANLGVFYSDRFQRLGELTDLEKAIESCSRALALTPDGHPHISLRHANLGRYTNLGLSYRDRFRRLGELTDLEKAIECCSLALALTPNGHPEMSLWHANLGVFYRDRFRRLGELTDLEKAIEYCSFALASTPDSHPHMSVRHANLGLSYRDRFHRLGELTDLKKAIECHSRALALTPNTHPEMSLRHANLGLSYHDRFQRLGELTDLERSIECHSRALALTPDGHPDMSRRHSDLGLSYRDRFQCLDELTDLEKAIKCDSRALALTPNGHPDVSLWQANLGLSYRERYTHLGELVDLEKAVKCASLALALAPDGHPDLPTWHFNQGQNHLSLYQHTANPTYLHHSLESLRSASQLSTGSPRDKFRYALHWANLASEQSLLNPMEAYQTAINLLPQFIWLGATTNQQYQDLSMTESLAVKACFAAILSSHYSLALEWLEHARCVVWNQSLMLRSPLDQLRLSHPDLATRLEVMANQLQISSFETQASQSLSSSLNLTEQAGQQRRHVAIEYNSLLTHIRELPGFSDFLRPMNANRLITIARNGPVVVINCHEARCDALVIMPGHKDIMHLPLPNFTELKAWQARSDLDTSLRHQRLRERGVRLLGQLVYKDRIGSVLSILWSDIVKPVIDHLGYMDEVPKECLPHITWCPTGTLSFLPLHAAGDYDQPRSRVFDYAISSYTPTLTALLASSPSSLSRNCHVLAVGLATTPGHNSLPGIVKELAHIKAHMQNKATYSQLTDGQATTTAVLDAMEQHDWVHLACHAHQNVGDPTKSGFYLHNGTLDVASINRKSFKNKGLAFLSACQTATGDKELPDEAIHLASGILMGGYPSVIATMWSVLDDDAPFVADKVYGQLMKDGKIGNGEAGRALHYAVAGLREKVGEKEFGRWVPYIHIGS